MGKHGYDLTVTWTGNRGPGTTGVRDYDRSHTISADGPPDLKGTADPEFLGDPHKWNPEQLFVAALSQCHMLWYLGLCARAGVVVHEYVDAAHGTLVTEPDGRGRFTEVVLRPRIVVEGEDMLDKAHELHTRAHEMCFIAQSVTCAVRHAPDITTR
ncbi:MAG TPA: OsmC family protein [Nocardioidaceae bacterium]|nr:OsmC family protein [Nocardioidaceae bacterium]